jgi:thymidylate kinase
MIVNESGSIVKPTKRGLLIALEGGDRCGKSTQCAMVLEHVSSVLNQPVHFIKFPERTSAIGRVINEYLQCGNELSNQAIHLLFSANRWEFKYVHLKGFKMLIFFIWQGIFGEDAE